MEGFALQSPHLPHLDPVGVWTRSLQTITIHDSATSCLGVRDLDMISTIVAEDVSPQH